MKARGVKLLDVIINFILNVLDNVSTEIKQNTPNTSNTSTTKLEIKEKLLEEKFEFNEETINYFTKDLDAKKIFINHGKNAAIIEKINDTKIICLLLKIGHIKDYHCSSPKCKVGKLWNGEPIQLILNRINNIQNDLSFNNLKLICGNCFMVNYGLEMFIKKKKEIILTCDICKFPLVKFKDNRKKKGICLSCEKQMSKISFEKQEDNFYNQLKTLYSDNTVLSDDIKYKKYDTNYNSKYSNGNSNTQNKSKYSASSQSQSTQSVSSLPLIELNMSIPNLSDLIDI